MQPLHYTGHPFVDVGIATLLARAKKRRPEELTDEDLADAANYIETMFVKPPLTSLLTMVLPNSGFTQPKYAVEKKQEYARIVSGNLGAEFHRSDEQCVFTGEPALSIPLSFKESLPPGRAYRQHIPLLTGEGAINFFPDGDAGLPVSGIALLALQILPLGCAKCGVGLLAAHSDNPQLTLALTRRFYEKNAQAISQASQSGEKKMIGAGRSPKTLLIEGLIEADSDRLEFLQEEGVSTSLTAYNFTNSGRGAKLVIYHLPLEIFSYIKIAQQHPFKRPWDEIARRSWKKAHAKKARKGETTKDTPAKNSFYEDLFGLPQQAERFIKRHFLRADGQAISWPLLVQFLRKVMKMRQAKIEVIERFGDHLASYVAVNKAKRFLREFRVAKSFDAFRQQLIHELQRSSKTDNLLFGFEQFTMLFVEEEEFSSWRLVRDLLVIRVIERLYTIDQEALKDLDNASDEDDDDEDSDAEDNEDDEEE